MTMAEIPSEEAARAKPVWLEQFPNATRWGTYVNRRLDELRDNRDPDTLNGFGVSWPSTWLIEQARKVAADLFPPDTPSPAVVPGGDDHPAIDFIWHKNDWHIYVEVTPTAVTMAAHRVDQPPEDWIVGTVEQHRDELTRLLGRISYDIYKSERLP